MFPEVRAEMARKNIYLRDLASNMDCNESTLCKKLNGKAPLKLKDALIIKQVLQSDLPLEELFSEAKK